MILLNPSMKVNLPSSLNAQIDNFLDDILNQEDQKIKDKKIFREILDSFEDGDINNLFDILKTMFKNDRHMFSDNEQIMALMINILIDGAKKI